MFSCFDSFIAPLNIALKYGHAAASTARWATILTSRLPSLSAPSSGFSEAIKITSQKRSSLQRAKNKSKV